MCKCVVLVVEFTRSKYTGSESSGFIEVVVIISGGSSTSPISVMVTTSEQTARGEGYDNNYIWITTCTLAGSGMDFDSNTTNLMFASGEVNKSVNISVTCDKIVERTERFDISLALTINNPQVRTGRDRSQAVITDSTGK